MNRDHNTDDLYSPFDDILKKLGKTRRKEAYKFACETRRFEIELYWKRATYFWGFLIVAFGGYGLALKEFGFRHIYTFVLTLVGFTFSLAWYLANRGSKFWQKNWEHHIGKLEDEFAGPIYKSPVDIKPFRFLELSSAYPMSISRLNQMISLYITVIWFFLAALGVSSLIGKIDPIACLNEIVIGVVTIVFIYTLLMCRFRGRRKVA